MGGDDNMANAIYWWLEAYNFFPNRIENLYEIIHHYRCVGKNKLAYGFYLMAEQERKKNKTQNHKPWKRQTSDVTNLGCDKPQKITNFIM